MKKKKKNTSQKEKTTKVAKINEKVKNKKEEIKEVIKVKKERITLPKYTLGEELISSISHGVGALLSIVALILCIIAGIRSGLTTNIVAGIFVLNRTYQ